MRASILRASVLIACGALLTLISCHSPAPQNQSATTTTESLKTEKTLPAEIVRANATEIIVPAGGQSTATVDLTIADNFHINANPPSASYLIPTTLSIAPADGLRADEFVYPSPLNKKFSFAEQPIAVYEKSAQIKFKVRAERSSSPGAHKLRATLRVQPCDENACYAPRTVETSLPVTVR